MKKQIDLKKIIGKGYNRFWHFKGRYLVTKGGRGSKKSKTAALKIMYLLTKYPLSNALIVRQTYVTLKDSVWKELQWAAQQLGVDDVWVFNRSPLQAVNKLTKQVIIFRGLDDPLGLTSLTVAHGVLNLVWIEEAYQIRSEDAFNKLDMSIRGQLPKGYFKQIIITFNPWSQYHWLNDRFFKKKDPNTLALTTNYLSNEFLGHDDMAIFEKMKIDDPQRYACEGLGEWGSVSGLVYRYTVQSITDAEIIKNNTVWESFGLDFGFVNDPTAFVRIIVDETNRKIYIRNELIYETGLTNPLICQRIKDTGYQNRTIFADTEFKSIQELQDMGCYNILPAKKGPNYKAAAVKQLSQYLIVVDPSCINFLKEISSYAWVVDRDGQTREKLPDGNDHLLDALIYASQKQLTSIKKPRQDIRRHLRLR